MKNQNTRRGNTQPGNAVIHKSHSRGMLSGIFHACRGNNKEEISLLNGYVEDPQLQPLGMTPLFDNNGCVEDAEQKPLSIHPCNVNKNSHSKFNLESHHVLLSKVRSRIKYGMTHLYDNDRYVEDPQLQPLGKTTNWITPHGFTLIELLVVVLIIGILAAVALPQYQKAVAKAHFAQVVTAAKSLKESIELYYMEHGKYPNFWKDVTLTYPQCPESIVAEYMLSCDTFVADLYEGSTYNLVFYGGPKEGKNIINSWSARDASLFIYRVWLDHSNQPGKVTCSSSVDGLCKSMGF